MQLRGGGLNLGLIPKSSAHLSRIESIDNLSTKKPACARVIAQSLRGGIGARSVEGALYQLQAALRRGLLLDVAAYFDSISSQLVTKTLEHLGAPVRLAPLLNSFYQQALRTFSFDGMLSKKWSKTCLGIPFTGVSFIAVRSCCYSLL